MERFWLKFYPDGVPHDIDSGEYSSVIEIFKKTCERYPDSPGYSNFGKTLTFSQVDSLSKQFAAYLQNDLGMTKGDRLGIMLPNVLQYPVALFGAMRAGIVVVNIDPLYRPRELTHQLNDSGADAILFLENFGDVVEQTLPQTSLKHVISTRLGDCLDFPKSMLINLVLKYVKKAIPRYTIADAVRFSDAMKIAQQSSCVDVELAHDDIIFLQYTGGTTGVAKGAILTHGNIVSNILQANAWISGEFSHGQDKAIAALPAYHIFCMTANILTMMSMGIENILITNPRDFEGFVRILRKTDFNIIIGVNTLYRKLLNTPGFDQIQFKDLKLSFAGGMAVTKDVASDWEKATNSVMVEAYGLTETSPAVCINPLNITEFTGSIGMPISSTYVQIKDDEDNDVGIDTAGELCVKGPQVTPGYWNRPDTDKECFTSDGYFRTGDYAQIDGKGYVRILDRKKNMILVSGFNVFPSEIEDVVCQHPDVVEAAAIGIPDDDAGEVVKLFIVKSNPTLSEDDIKKFCREQMTGYKRPKEVEFVDEIPKTNVGKISHKDLRAKQS